MISSLAGKPTAALGLCRFCKSLSNRGHPRAVPVICQAASGGKTASVDYQEIRNVVGGTALEVAVWSSVFIAIDQVQAPGNLPGLIPGAAFIWALLLFMSFRSRVASPFDASRPEVAKKGFEDRKRPSWCPPKLVFPIAWTSIAALRASSGVMVWQACDKHLFCLPLLMFVLHLSIGDTWNYITNAQSRLGWSAVVMSIAVWPSIAVLTALYFITIPSAGLTILPALLFLTFANALVWGIWDANDRQPLLPETGM